MPNIEWTHLVALVGEEHARLLVQHYAITPLDAWRKTRDALEREQQRVTRLAARAIKGVGRVALEMTLTVQENGLPSVSVCCPTGQEEEYARMAGAILIDSWRPPKAWGKVEMTEGARSPGHVEDVIVKAPEDKDA